MTDTWQTKQAAPCGQCGHPRIQHVYGGADAQCNGCGNDQPYRHPYTPVDSQSPKEQS